MTSHTAGWPQRRSVRLRDYDYAQPGAYFITICTYQRESWLGAIVDGVMQANAAGEMVRAVWDALPQRFPTVTLDQFAVMPNHVHGIVMLAAHDAVAGARRTSLGEIVRAFKAATTWQIRRAVNPAFGWQRNYYEHVVRDDRALQQIRQYIHDNPARWADDPENPQAAARPTQGLGHLTR